MKKLIHPAIALLARNLEAEQYACTRSEELIEMDKTPREKWAKLALTSIEEALVDLKIKPIEFILTGDAALYIHGLSDEPPTSVDVIVKKHILDKIQAGGTRPISMFDFTATVSNVILDTMPYGKFRLITIDQILKVLKQSPTAVQNQYAETMSEIEKRISARIKTHELDCVKNADLKSTKPKPQRSSYDDDYRNSFHWEDRKSHSPKQMPRKKDWRK